MEESGQSEVKDSNATDNAYAMMGAEPTEKAVEAMMEGGEQETALQGQCD